MPPQNIEAEQRVLGAILLDGGEGGTVANVMEVLRPEHLYRLSHRVIYQAMISLFEKNDPIDILTVVDALKKMSKLEEAGGPEYVARLSDDVSSSRRAATYARLVRATALQRSLIQTSNAIAERAFQDSEDVDTLIDDAERAIFEVSSDRYEQKIGTMKEIVKTTFPHLEELYDKKELVTGVPTGFTDLDKLTSGFQPGELIIVAGRPSMGKTAFALCIAEYAAINARVPTAIFSLEMSSRALAIRMMCGRAMVNAKQLQSGYMPARRWPDLIRAAGELSESQIFVDDSTESSAFDIRAKCRRLQADQGLGLVIVDYLQLISNRTSGGRYESRQLEISEITRSLKGMAKELDLPVVALSQLSRAVESREGKRPGLADLRESGSIEQDADLVALLYREDYYDRESDKKGEATVIVAKQRNGPTDDVQLRFFQDYTRFTNLDTFHEGSPVPAAEVFEEEEEVGF
ncbi:MAG: replicative DNA helicase [Nitrospinaceae bacterium]|nr:replicative DNA helicase [Nitrospinaceae bacterium]MBT3435279.1 replicative DNA helicase [Nitrospinaceae bacterium]MBT3822306.1 replicative DNA helicase [Nitrospinaceae bacterium]MBT4094834.1 replicative DNA helicase [Nitrospinaceae bacterium]MBT4431884.1 replicative DNA helicase [Nitrospinaceae bacterium]